MMTEKNRFKLHLTLTILVMAFIFFQSSLTGLMSGRESGFLVEIISGFLSWVQTGPLAGVLPAPLLEALDADPASIGFAVRKCAHFTEYLVLGICLMLTCRDVGMGSAPPWSWPAFAWVIGTVFAGTDEIHQLFVTDRSGEIRDVMIDSAGVLVGVILTVIVTRRRAGKDRK